MRPDKSTLADRNPKLAAVSVTVLAVSAIQAGAVVVGVGELLTADGPRFDRYLMGLVPMGVIWMLVAIVDLLAFPSMRMTRLLIGPAIEVAVIATLVTTAMSVALGVAEGTLAIGAVFADNAAFFILVWGIASLWKLGREWLRSAQGYDRSLRDSVAQHS